MATKKELIKNLDWVTEKISSQVWTLNLGTLATTWSLLIVSNRSEGINLTIRNAVWIFVPCLLSLICEMGQYLSGYWLERHLLTDMETHHREEFHYPTGHFLYKMRRGLFAAKITLTVAAAAILVFMLFEKFV
jgi:hypothetical protein